MIQTEKQDFEIAAAATAQGELTFSARISGYLRARMGPLRTGNDVSRLNARMRRDAGIDELKLERTTLARRPLIR